ncbi:16390_t:CDS:2, partial [Dentiscutata heterogama]
MTENNNIELVLKQQSVINSYSECPIITYEIVKKLGLEKDKSSHNIIDKAVSHIIKQQDIINSIMNSDISWQCKAKRKKTIFNDTASESSSESESGSKSSYDNENFTVDMIK